MMSFWIIDNKASKVTVMPLVVYSLKELMANHEIKESN